MLNFLLLSLLSKPSEQYFKFSSCKLYRVEERQALGCFCSCEFGNGSRSLQDRADGLYNDTGVVLEKSLSCSFSPSQGLDYPLGCEAV